MYFRDQLNGLLINFWRSRKSSQKTTKVQSVQQLESKLWVALILPLFLNNLQLVCACQACQAQATRPFHSCGLLTSRHFFVISLLLYCQGCSHNECPVRELQSVQNLNCRVLTYNTFLGQQIDHRLISQKYSGSVRNHTHKMGAKSTIESQASLLTHDFNERLRK